MRNSKAYRAVGTLVCLIFTAFFMFPLAIMLVRSFSKGGPSNYVKVFDKYNLWNNFSTSVLVVGLSLVIVALVVSFAAYAFAKLEFRGKKLLYYTLLGGMMVPAAATIYPLYQIVKLLGLVSSPFSLILPYATGSRCFNLMILKNYYDAIPDEMIEAASIDGAEGIPEKWKAPLGDKIVTMCIDKTWGGIWVPQTCTELAERVMRVTPGFLGAELCDVLNPDGYTIRCADELYCLNQMDYQPRMNGSGKDHHLPVRELARLGSNILRKEYPAFEVLVNLQGDPYFKHGENRRFSVTVRNCFEMRRQEWARITLHAPDRVEILSGKEIMLPLNNLWGACAEAEFEFNADFYPSAKLELLVDVQLEGRHSYGVVKVVVTRKG